jgi:hypothetical protein
MPRRKTAQELTFQQHVADYLVREHKCGVLVPVPLKPVSITIESQIATLPPDRTSLIHECVTGQRRVTEEDLKWAHEGSPEA